MYRTKVSIFGRFVHFECFCNALGYCIGIWRLSLQLLLRWWHLLDSYASDQVTFHARLRILLQVSSGGDASHLLSARLLRTLYSMRRTNMKSLKCECAGKIMSGLSGGIGWARMYYYYF